jgi:hypothetical protein
MAASSWVQFPIPLRTDIPPVAVKIWCRYLDGIEDMPLANFDFYTASMGIFTVTTFGDRAWILSFPPLGPSKMCGKQMIF